MKISANRWEKNTDAEVDHRGSIAAKEPEVNIEPAIAG
jgi:hypothetical protein